MQKKTGIEVLLKGTRRYWWLKRGWKRQVCVVLCENQSWLWIGGNFWGRNLSIFYLSGCQWKLIWWSISIRVTAEHDGKGQIFFWKYFYFYFVVFRIYAIYSFHNHHIIRKLVIMYIKHLWLNYLHFTSVSCIWFLFCSDVYLILSPESPPSLPSELF